MRVCVTYHQPPRPGDIRPLIVRGCGTYLGRLPDGMPVLQLDTGELLTGSQCWWMPEEQAVDLLDSGTRILVLDPEENAQLVALQLEEMSRPSSEPVSPMALYLTELYSRTELRKDRFPQRWMT